MLDLVLRGARVIDPSQEIDGRLDVAFADGRVVALAESIGDPARVVRDATGLILTPGLIDLHTHVYWGGTSMGVSAAEIAARSAVTTLVDAGSAGPANFLGLRHHIIEPADVRILAFLNISFPGIFAYSAPVMVGECCDLRLLEPTECIRVINENRDLIVGVKVRIGRIASGASGIAPLDMALEVAAETGLPVMAHIDHPPPSRREVVMRLRPGDILTHCFKPFPNTLLRSDGEIWEEVRLARERGVIFDLGHGGMSFGFHTAAGMLAKGFMPDVLSTDLHVLSVDGPAFDLLTTVSKFHALGVDLPTLIRATTCSPAAAIRRPELGTLRPGSPGDATLIALEQGKFTYHDCLGVPLESDTRLVARGAVRRGVWSDH